ncbi:MAG: hypothetical protein RLZZ336_2096 [Cyanobacteriota bacterium]
MSPARGIPTSRAYWELKAEQMLNRVFSNEAPIELEIVEPAQPNSPRPAPATATATATPKRGPAPWLPVAVAAAGLSSAVVMAVAWALFNQQQQVLRQERNLVLLERLRNLGPAAPTGDGAATGTTASTELPPPPPPGEPWMEELAQLPASGAPTAAVLKVPFTTAIGHQAAREGLPQLVGVVQSQGSGSSAIFQIGGSSSSAAVGDTIAGSGWRLRSVTGDGAVIERGGQVRRLSISSGL